MLTKTLPSSQAADVQCVMYLCYVGFGYCVHFHLHHVT